MPCTRKPLRGGGWRLVVAIADVSHYVRVGSALDVEARARATSVYFPDRVLPMLPEHLSNHLCSLMPQVERLAFVCDMRVSKAGMPGRTRFYEAVIRSHARLTYDRAWAYLENPRGAAGAELTPAGAHLAATTCYAVYGALKSAREARGALDFRGGEVKARIGEDGTIEGFYAVMRNDAHRLDRRVHDRRQRGGGGGAAARQGGKPVPRARSARREAGDRTAEGHECAAGGRDVFGEAEPARVSPAGRAAGRAAGRRSCSRAW